MGDSREAASCAAAVRGNAADGERELPGSDTHGAAALADAIVAKIRSITRTRTLEHALEIGEILVQGAYDGDAEAVRRDGERHPVYRRIAAHPELPFGAKQLWVCIKLHALVTALPQFRSAQHLGVAHLRAVVNLPCEVQARLLTSAERESWTSAHLEMEARSFRQVPSNRGRPPTIALCRAVERIERVARQVESELSSRLRGKLSSDRAVTARESLRRARERLDAIEAELLRWTNVGATAVR